MYVVQRPVTSTSTTGAIMNSRSMSGSEGVVFSIGSRRGSFHSMAKEERDRMEKKVKASTYRGRYRPARSNGSGLGGSAGES